MSEDLDAILRQLAERTDAVQEAWDAAEIRRAREDEDEPDLGYDLWLTLEHDSGEWACSYCYRPDEATLVALLGGDTERPLSATGPTALAAAMALQTLIEAL